MVLAPFHWFINYLVKRFGRFVLCNGVWIILYFFHKAGLFFNEYEDSYEKPENERTTCYKALIH